MKKAKIEIGGVEAEAVFVWNTNHLDNMALHAVCIGGIDILPALTFAAAAGEFGNGSGLRRAWLFDTLCEMIAKEVSNG